MTIQASFSLNHGVTPPSGWVALNAVTTIGASVIQNGITLEIVQPFSTSFSSSTTHNQDHDGIPESVLESYAVVNIGAGTQLKVSGLAASQSGYIRFGGAVTNSGRDRLITIGGTTTTHTNPGGTAPITPEPPVDAPFTADANGEVLMTLGAAVTNASFPFMQVGTSASTPTITNIDTDNAVNQYQQNAVIALSDFTETITSVTLNGTVCPIQSQVVGTSVTVDLPGSLATGSYDLVVSGATETDTLTGVSYTQTHARPALDGLVDSNSILSGQSYTPNTYFRFVTSFSNGTLDTATGDAAEWAGDIADYYTPNAGFTGDDTASIEFLYSDGTTSATVGVTISVVDGVVNSWPFGKGINPTATKNWTWGKRHPKTGMRVRVYE